MSDEIKAAMTAGQWLETDAPEYSGDHKKNTLFAYVATEASKAGTDAGELVVGWNDETMYPMSSEQRHALAALCLHGQSFGFTRQDVGVLRAVAKLVLDRAPSDLYATPVAAERLRDLSDRIEALLPPEES